jgi:hypothetical protein
LIPNHAETVDERRKALGGGRLECGWRLEDGLKELLKESRWETSMSVGGAPQSLKSYLHKLVYLFKDFMAEPA